MKGGGKGKGGQSSAYRLRPVDLGGAIPIDGLVKAKEGGRGPLWVWVRRPIGQDPKVPIRIAPSSLWRAVPREAAHRPAGSTPVPPLRAPHGMHLAATVA